MPNLLQRRIVKWVESQVGTHDEFEAYGAPAGDPGLLGPGSMSWEIHSDMGAISAAGIAAIIMEILHPAVMAGVHDRSSYQTQTLRRAKATLGYVIVTTFGNTEAASRTIARVRRMHEQVHGTMPDGRPYRAMDPELIGWVHTAIPWAIMESYDRWHRPLSTAEKNRYLSEQAIIGRLGGAGDIPESVGALAEYVERMRPRLAVNEQTRGFFEFLLNPTGRERPQPLDRLQRRLSVHGSMQIMPEWSRKLTGFDHPELVQRFYLEPMTELNVKLIRWAFGTPAYRRLADARVASARRSAA
jgi:uncharacterized protein (DUF2236 family)